MALPAWAARHAGDFRVTRCDRQLLPVSIHLRQCNEGYELGWQRINKSGHAGASCHGFGTRVATLIRIYEKMKGETARVSLALTDPDRLQS